MTPTAILIEPEVERLEKLLRYYEHFNVEKRYEISFKEFTRKVDEGTWEAYLADNMTLQPRVRESCYSQ